MTTQKRKIKGKKFNIEELVGAAFAAVQDQKLNLEEARKALTLLGHRDPAEELVIRYAREKALLKHLAGETGANFLSQLGKIDFSSREKAIAGVNSYLNRRIAGQHARWTEEHTGRWTK